MFEFDSPKERNIVRIENCYAVETAHSAEKFNWEKGNREEQQMVKMKSVPCEIRKRILYLPPPPLARFISRHSMPSPLFFFACKRILLSCFIACTVRAKHVWVVTMRRCQFSNNQMRWCWLLYYCLCTREEYTLLLGISVYIYINKRCRGYTHFWIPLYSMTWSM